MAVLTEIIDVQFNSLGEPEETVFKIPTNKGNYYWIVISNLTPFAGQVSGIHNRKSDVPAIQPGTVNKWAFTGTQSQITIQWHTELAPGETPTVTPQVIIELGDEENDFQGVYPFAIPQLPFNASALDVQDFEVSSPGASGVITTSPAFYNGFSMQEATGIAGNEAQFNIRRGHTVGDPITDAVSLAGAESAREFYGNDSFVFFSPTGLYLEVVSGEIFGTVRYTPVA